MSLLDELTAELCAASGHLPLVTLRHAVTDMHRANDRLVHAIRLRSAASLAGGAGSGIACLARLGAATTHLQTGTALMMRAQDEVDSYLAAIGAHARTHVATTPAVIRHNNEAWWTLRVATLTAQSGPACDDPARTSSELLQRVLAAVRAGDRVALHAQLLGAGAGVGSSATGRAGTVLRGLATDLLGRAPTPDDVPALRSRAGTVGDLLPNLPPAAITTLLRRACGAVDAGGHDAVDLAVGSAVVVARLCCALGREQVLDG
jgi:hypothetical protein